ncbi:MAG: MMPL family transporter [Myxococcota bacterium]|nr:MMPL family transporter [Myxococcota bacterium]
MKDRIDEIVGRGLHAWIARVHAQSRFLVWGILALTLLLGVYAALNLGVNSDNLALLSPELPSRRNHAEFSRHFPNLENALLVVIDGDTPELAREGAEQLATALRANPSQFEDVYLPGGGFFERNGLLYRTVDELDEFADEIAAIQPLIAELEHDASIANLAQLVEAGLESVQDGTADAQDWPAVLDRVGTATVGVYAEYPIAISWEEVLLKGSAVDLSTRRVLIVHAALEFGSVFAAGQALDAIREAAASLGLAPARGVTVRITGNPALNFEEMAGILWDIFVAGIFCFALVVVILWFALRSWHIVTAAVSTLLVGLVWTAAFAALSVGYLNIVSLAVAILFIGLGVDFAIHLGSRYADRLREADEPLHAMTAAVEDVGGSLVLCTITTSIGFLVFVPTDYRGVAELGLIAGVGMGIILTLTLSLFPALLFSWLRFDASRHLTRAVRFETHWWKWFDEHPRHVRIAAAAAGVLALVLIPRAHFSPNVLDIRDPATESVQTFDDLLAQAGSASPWYVDAIAPNLEAAEALAHRLEELEVVSHAVTLVSYVPPDQEEKHEVLADISFLIEPPPPGDASRKELSVDEQVAALRKLHDFLAADWLDRSDSTLGASVRGLRSYLATFLARIEADGDPTEALGRLEDILLSGLTGQLARLRQALEPEEITLESLPEELRRRMIASNGLARVQIFPQYDLDGEEAMRPFVEDVASIAPRASGIAINLIALEEATKRSFQQSLIAALSLISLLLWLLWRRLADTLLVLAPLLLSAGLAVGFMGLFDIPFNFVNVIVIPLMFGIGVDSGIHLVHQSHSPVAARDGLLGTTTARAVYYSAVTTTVSFGSLALSSHRGMASLGVLLTFGMLLTLVGNLIVLPSLIALRQPSTPERG